MISHSKRILCVFLWPILCWQAHAVSIQELTSSKTAQEVSQGKIKIDDHFINNYKHRHGLGLGLGQTFLRRGLAANGDDGLTPDLYYSYGISSRFDFLTNFHSNTLARGSSEVKILGLNCGAKYRFYQFDSFSAFTFGGPGFYRPRVTRMTADGPTTSEGKWVMGFHAGTGIQLDLNHRYTVAFLGHYHDPFDVEQDNGDPVTGAYFKMLIVGSYYF
jgi:hypothetical protein